MVNMIIHGCGGAMGQVLSELAAEDREIQVAAGIDPRGGIKRDYPVYESFQACGAAADVVVVSPWTRTTSGFATFKTS